MAVLEQREKNIHKQYQEIIAPFIVALDDSEEAILFASTQTKQRNTINITSIVVTAISIVIAIISFL